MAGKVKSVVRDCKLCVLSLSYVGQRNGEILRDTMTERTGGSFSLLCAGRSKCLSKKKKKRFNAFLLFFDPSEKQPLSKQVQKLAAKLKKKKVLS